MVAVQTENGPYGTRFTVAWKSLMIHKKVAINLNSTLESVRKSVLFSLVAV